MNLSTIDMPRAEARRQFEDYRRAARDRHSAEDKAIAAGYKAISEGRAVIQLTPTLQAGGVAVLERTRRVTGRGGRLEDQGQRVTVPRLAVARANRKYAWTHGVQADGNLVIAAKQPISEQNQRDRIVFEPGTFDVLAGTRTIGWGDWNRQINALVPPVPPRLRPRDNIANYHVLWEAEWSFTPGPPPGDPALLKHIGGDLYAVHAVWDLTPLEQAVLAGRSFEA
jgi:hypothetical protein